LSYVVDVVLVGLGFLSANLALEFAEAGYRVAVLSRGVDSPRKRALADAVRGRAEVVQYGDLGDALARLSPGIVVNTVGEFFGSREALWDANARFPERLCGAVKRVGAVKLVHVSAATVVGPARGVVREEEPHLSGLRPATEFEESKMVGERVVAGCGVDYVIARPVLMYGRFNDHPEYAMLVRWALRGVVPAPRGAVSAIEVSEAARAIRLLAERATNTHVFVTECEPYDLGDIPREVARLLGARVVSVPLGLLRIVGPLISRELASHLRFVGTVYSCEKMLSLTGYRPVRRLGEGVAEMVQWILRLLNLKTS